jgi:hypothetical protein
MCDIKKHNECSCSNRCHQDLGSFTSRAADMNRRHRDIEAKVAKQTNAVVVTTLLALSMVFAAWVFVGEPAQHRIDLAQQESGR